MADKNESSELSLNSMLAGNISSGPGAS